MVTRTAHARDVMIEKGYRVVAFGDIRVFEQSLRSSVDEVRRLAGTLEMA